jgi:hypothetical protein
VVTEHVHNEVVVNRFTTAMRRHGPRALAVVGGVLIGAVRQRRRSRTS